MNQKTKTQIKGTLLAVGLVGGLSFFPSCRNKSENVAPIAQSAAETTSIDIRKATDDPFSTSCDQLKEAIAFDLRAGRNKISHSEYREFPPAVIGWDLRAVATEMEASNLLKVYDSKGCKAVHEADKKAVK